MKQELLTHWQIQESLLQSYRKLFAITQTIIFSAACVVCTNANPKSIIFILLLFLGAVILYYWNQVASARALDVSYFQMMILKAERNEQIENIMTNFKSWQKLGKHEKLKLLDDFGLAWSQTRTTMESYIPLLFLILWLALLIIDII